MIITHRDHHLHNVKGRVLVILRGRCRLPSGEGRVVPPAP